MSVYHFNIFLNIGQFIKHTLEIKKTIKMRLYTILHQIKYSHKVVVNEIKIEIRNVLSEYVGVSLNRVFFVIFLTGSPNSLEKT